jgi:DNA (cytosine-5)-methyltransferase 1
VEGRSSGQGKSVFRSLEICAGAGGQALGLERAGFAPAMLIDNDPDTCATLRTNRPHWDVRQTDVRPFTAAEHPQVLDVDLMSGGMPRTPYSVASRQHGADDERDLLEVAIWLASEVRPKAIMIENVPPLLTDAKFAEGRRFVYEMLDHLGYQFDWGTLNAEAFGVPQRRPHSVLIAMRPKDFDRFQWPEPIGAPPTVGEVLRSSMASGGWPGADAWATAANTVAPTIVGGSKKHGGADLGPTGAKKAWARLGINGTSLGDAPPPPDFVLMHGVGKHGRDGLPRLTIPQVARLQGFPDDWIFAGKKTSRYRQVAQTLPPPVAEALGRSIAEALAG